MNRRNKLLLGLILIIFLVTRLVNITKNPPSLYWDEASIGYNAYSVLETGKDEWGEFLPLHFRAFGEFKLPVYIYSVVLTTKIFGVGELAIRLPAVIYTFGSLILVCLLAEYLFKDDLISLFSVFILSVTPWLFILSRVGYEATAGLFFYLLTIYLLLLYLDKSLKKKIGVFLMLLRGGFVGLAFILSIYSYNSFRLLSPLTFVLILFFFFLKERKNFLKRLQFLVFPLLLIFISFIPIYKLYRFDAGASRLQAISLQGTRKEKVIQFSKNYLSHFSYDFLFRSGDENLRSQMPGFGQLYIVSLPFILLGLYYVLRERKLESLLLLILILMAPFPATITKESPHAMRVISMAPFMSILISLGLLQLLNFVKRQKTIVIASIVIIYFVSFGFYLFKFFYKYPSLSSQDWQHGYKMIVRNYSEEFSDYKNIIISDRYAQPYIFILYYTKHAPSLLSGEIEYNPPEKWGFSTVSSFDSFKFKRVEKDDVNENSLIFTTKSDRLNRKADSEIYFLDGSTAFWVYKI